MKNFDRALAYAKQRGVEIPQLSPQVQVKDLRHTLIQSYNIDPPMKMKKADLMELLTIERIIHSGGLTQAQIKRLGQKHDDKRTLRDRHATKVQRKIRRRRWLFT